MVSKVVRKILKKYSKVTNCCAILLYSTRFFEFR